MTRTEIPGFVERYLSAWKKEDIPALVAFHTPDAEVESPLFRTIRGHAAIYKSFENLFRALTDWSFTVDDVIIDSDDSNHVVLLMTSQLTHHGDLLGFPGSGRRLNNPIAQVFRFSDGLIASDKRMYDFNGLLVQLGIVRAKGA